MSGFGSLPSFHRGAAGISPVELLLALAVAATVLAVIVPGVHHLRSSVAIRSAAGQVRAAFYRARMVAIKRGVLVGVKFRRNGGRQEWALYADGNGNGVRNAEITSGVDRPLGVFYPWDRNDVLPGILTGARVPDPGSPGSYLDRPDDPIRFNNSDICSFSPVGESTPGSVYLWDGHDRMAVVRVFGRSAKIRTLYHRRGEPGWRK
ncbi:MAG: GspH/FimT family protein [Thermoanaerobaculia bacterium]